MEKVLKYFSILLMFALLPFASLLQVKASALNNNLAKSGASETVFMVDAKYIASTTNGTYIFDASDNCLKLLNSDFSKSTSYVVSNDILDLCALEDNIYMLVDNGILIFDTNTSSISFMPLTLSGQTKISASKLSSQSVLCLYPTDINSGDGEIDVLYAVFNIVEEPETPTLPEEDNEYNQTPSEQLEEQTCPQVQPLIFNKLTFAGNEISQTTGISFITFIEYNSQVYVMRAYNKSLTAYPVDLGGDITASGNIPLLSPESTGLNTPIIGMQSVYSTSPTMIISYQDQTYIYDVYTNNPSNPSSLGLEPANTISHTKLGDNTLLSAISMSACGDNVSVLGDNCYIELSTQTGKVVSSTSNPVCTTVYRNSANFTYYKLTKSNSLIMSPDSKESTLIGAEEECYVVEIADVYLPNNTKLLGYKYVMYTTTEEQAEVNKFGYIYTLEDGLEEIAQPTNSKVVKVNNKTKLYSYPSTAVDATNKVITTISNNLPVKVLSYIDGYFTPYGNTTCKYALVLVDGKVGFIDVQEILPSDKRIVQVIPNAEIISGTNVYEYADTSSKILHKLEECKKVRILEGRNAQGFIKIAYNDDEGNYYQGYIKASSVKAHSYTTLQIIGAVLVLLNVIFLIILIVTKRKIVK